MKELSEDIEQYKGIIEDFKNLDSSDYSTAYVLSQLALITADRWNEIMLNSVKYAKETQYFDYGDHEMEGWKGKVYSGEEAFIDNKSAISETVTF